MGSAVEEVVEAHRRLEPELYDKVDRIARIIDPSGFAEWYDGTGEDAKRLDTLRMKHARSRARRKAMEVLRELGIAPETTDWAAIFREAGWTEPAP